MKKDIFKILIVDDVWTNIELMLSILNKEGYDISYANSGENALQKIEEEDFDLLLLDVIMPQMDGFSLCKILKANQETKDIPVIFLTARDDHDSFMRGFEVGGVDYITKPFKRHETLARISAHLELKRSREELKQELAERKQAQETLRITSERLEIALNAGHLYWWDWYIESDQIEYLSLLTKKDQITTSTMQCMMQRIHADDLANAKKILEDYIEGKRDSYIIEYRMEIQPNDWRWLRSGGKIAEYSEQGKVTRIIGVVSDITEQKQNEEKIQEQKQKLAEANKKLKLKNKEITESNEKLKENRELYRTLVCNLPQIDVYVFDNDMRFMIVEGSEMRKYGFHFTIIEGKTVFESLDKELIPYFVQIFQTALGGKNVSQEYFLFDTWYHHQVVPLRNENGEIFGGLFVAQNITEQKRAIDAIKKSESKYRIVIEQAPDGIFNTDFQGNIIDVNTSFCNMLNYSRAEILHKNIEDFILNDKRQPLVLFADEPKSDKSFVTELNLIRADKKFVPVEVNCKMLSDGRIQGFVRDITERKEAEILLRKSEEKFSKVFHLSPEAIIISEAATQKIIDLNNSAELILGYAKDKIIGKSDTEINIWHSKTDRKKFYQQIQSQSECIGLETIMINASGEHCNITISGRLIEFQNEESVIVVIQDITERKRAEEAVKFERQRFLSLLEHFPSFVCLIDEGFNIKYSNSKFQELFGDATKRTCFQVMKNQPQPCKPCLSQSVLTTQSAQKNEWTDEKGNTYLIQSSFFSDTDESPLVLEVGLDITDRKKNEEEMINTLEKERRLNEMKSKFVGTVSHEFRTPLSTISTNTQTLDIFREKIEKEQWDKSIKRIKDAVQEMTNMLDNAVILDNEERKLLRYRPVWIDLEEFCRDTIDQIVAISEPKPIIITQIDTKIGNTMIDRDLLKHILTNILSNAIKFSSPASPIQFIMKEHGQEKIQISIKDKGIGISENDMDFLFEQFHRGANTVHTKGTGLGMSIVKRCIDLCKGEIEVQSQLNKGTTVQIILPYNQK